MRQSYWGWPPSARQLLRARGAIQSIIIKAEPQARWGPQEAQAHTIDWMSAMC